jgi:hypothetical protein
VIRYVRACGCCPGHCEPKGVYFDDHVKVIAVGIPNRCECGEPVAKGLSCCAPCYQRKVEESVARNWRGIR